MSSADKRLDRLLPALSAKERALLTLRAWKQGAEIDPRIKLTVPAAQAASYNRFIGIMRAVAGELTHYVVVIHLLVEQLSLRHAWLQSMHLWASEAADALSYFTMVSKEPVTESEYAKLQIEARAVMTPVEVLAEMLALEETEVEGAAFRRLVRAKREELVGLMAKGRIAGERRGKRVLINDGSFYAWLGEPLPVVTEYGESYEVFPDGDGDRVKRERAARTYLVRTLRRAPLRLEGKTDFPTVEQAPGHRSMDEVAGALIDTQIAGVLTHWEEVRAVEIVLAEAAEDFDGEGLLHPEVQALLDGAKDRTLELHGAMQEYRTFPLQEPGEALLVSTRRLMRPD